VSALQARDVPPRERYRRRAISRLDVTDFHDEHLAEAGALLAARHARQRAVEPLLSPRFEEPDAARAELETVWRADRASGAAALSDGRLVAFLVGAPRAGTVWGPNVWVESAGHAAEDAEVVRDLYAHAADGWVGAGATSHYAVVPATDPSLLDAWSRLEFGQQHALGIQAVPPEPADPSPVHVRVATVDDIDDVLRLDILGEYQTSAPTFARHTAPDPDEAREELLEELPDPRAAALIAELDGLPVGIATVAPVEYSGLHTGVARPDGACILGYAATIPEVRGAGAGLALTEGVFAWARENGYTTIVVDWRVPNLLSSRFWPSRGFRTSFVRVHRSIA
jgi:GNAT superfamily N-acetyltransferase